MKNKWPAEDDDAGLRALYDEARRLYTRIASYGRESEMNARLRRMQEKVHEAYLEVFGRDPNNLELLAVIGWLMYNLRSPARAHGLTTEVVLAMLAIQADALDAAERNRALG